MRRALCTITAMIATVLGASACVPPTAVLPTAPAPTDAATTSAVVTVPASWSTPTQPDGTCATDGPPANTFSQTVWDQYLTDMATALGKSNPRFASISGVDFQFPAGCYYLDNVALDAAHPLIDSIIDGGYTGVPSQSPQFVQTALPDCATGRAMLELGSNSSNRVSLTGLTLQGSAPNDAPYCGGSPVGLRVAGARGATGPHNVTVSNNTIHNNWSDNFYVGTVDRLTVEGNSFSYGGRNVMGITAGNDLIIRHNSFQFGAGPLVDLETNQNADDLVRVVMQYNDGSYGNHAGTGTAHDNGVSIAVIAAAGTTVSDVAYLDNTSASALVVWLKHGVTSTSEGALHRVSVRSNTTTSNAGQFQIYAGDQLTITGNKLLGGPPVSLFNADGGYTWTQNPPTVLYAVPPALDVPSCGVSSGNTYQNASGAAVAWRTETTAVVFGYVMPACS